MNATLTTARGRHDHPTSSTESPAEYTARRVGVLDRLALHVGVALIKWGRRPRQVESRERLANRREQQLARLEREREYERTRLMMPPLR